MNTQNHNGRKLLIGKNEILDYLKISKQVWPKFVEMGLPVVVINQRFYAHTDNIDDFFRKVTARGIGRLPADAE